MSNQQESAEENDLRLSYTFSFENEKQKLIEWVLRWGEGDRTTIIDLDQFESCVFIKNSERVIVHANAALKNKLAGGQFLVGSSTDGLVDESVRWTSRLSDELVIGGVRSIDLEHVFVDKEGQAFELRTYKRRLDELKDPSLCLLAICRPIAKLGEMPSLRRLTLSQHLIVYRELDDTDQRICRLYFQGESTKAIAQQVGLATRSVELHRQKIMEAFGFDKPVEIIKLMTRLEEHQLIHHER